MDDSISSLPKDVQERIFSFLVAPPSSSASSDSSSHCTTTLSPAAAQRSPHVAGRSVNLFDQYLPDLVQQLKKSGVAVHDGVLGAAERTSILQEARGALQDGVPAKVGGGSTLRSEDRSVRGDNRVWLSHEGPSVAGRENIHSLVQVLKKLGPTLLANGFEVNGAKSVQLAVFPGQGTLYKRHRDTSPSSPLRRVTIIYYPNDEEWDPQELGGALRIFDVGAIPQACAHGQEGDRPWADISPRGDRLVIFNSVMEHQVLPTHAPRYAVTMWMSCADMGGPQDTLKASTDHGPSQSLPIARAPEMQEAPGAPPQDRAFEMVAAWGGSRRKTGVAPDGVLCWFDCFFAVAEQD
ncbi:hypothetical protein CYMTET_46722 [Cymbomonas tetramitiformis]|uniref:Fe2OG dioxygenase domain-containing protein n=1 Tax=Cymbomonas tetramitiformis TaxID=36881 RepID=A0AAE0EXC0_9CHLO|nr:hypothetical protein CYMTET_46722 [Cymbomonas tetramitiformis]